MLEMISSRGSSNSFIVVSEVEEEEEFEAVSREHNMVEELCRLVAKEDAEFDETSLFNRAGRTISKTRSSNKIKWNICIVYIIHVQY